MWNNWKLVESLTFFSLSAMVYLCCKMNQNSLKSTLFLIGNVLVSLRKIKFFYIYIYLDVIFVRYIKIIVEPHIYLIALAY